MRMASGRFPPDHLTIIPNALQRAPGFRIDHFREELLRKPHQVHVCYRVNAWQFEPKPSLDHRETVPFTQARVPFRNLLHPTRYRPVHPIEPSVPKVVFGENIIEVGIHPGVVLRGEKGESRPKPVKCILVEVEKRQST